MLLSLHIENYALIDRLDVEFSPGLNVFSGETGSGKSIVIDALGLLLGERADQSAIRGGAERAWVSGVFSRPRAKELLTILADLGLDQWAEAAGDQAGGELVVRREVGGRGRVFLNDDPVTLAALRQLAPWLGVIHAQNEALATFTPAAQLELLDCFRGDEAGAAGLRAAFAARRAAADALAALQSEVEPGAADLWRFQRDELAAAQLRAGEYEELEVERGRLANAEKILLAAQSAYAALYDDQDAAVARVRRAQRHADELARLDPSAAELPPRLAALQSELEDAASAFLPWTEAADAGPDRLAEIEDRLARLDRLKRKYGPTLADALRLRDQLEQKLSRLEQFDARLDQARRALVAADERYAALARAAAEHRRAAAQRLAKALEAEVADLAMRIRFQVDFTSAAADEPDHWTARGWDRLRFLAATNPGEELKPLAAIASGGELSRLLLGLQVVIAAASKDGSAPLDADATLVFDEIDAGIGGRAAEAVGAKLARLGRDRQILCVTHLAQIATHAARHLRVEKSLSRGRALTSVAELTGEERVLEVARMLSGEPTSAAKEHAAALLQAASTLQAPVKKVAARAK